MKKILFTLLLSITLLNAFSAHIKGGFLSYEYLGQGTVNPAFLRYKITLTVYTSCLPSPTQLTNPIKLTIFNGTGPTILDSPVVTYTRYELEKKSDELCISADQRGCYYTIAVYELNNYELPVSATGYTISYQRCCRIPGMENIRNSEDVGNTWSIKIPGTNSPVPAANTNSSPVFSVNDTAIVCSGNYFTYPISAIDKDKDVLTYSLCSAYQGGTTVIAMPNPASAPPYSNVIYTAPYSGTQPMGPKVSINSTTGLISGIAPVPATFGGEFVITVCVTETRGGVFLAETRKELHIQVKDCNPLTAKLDPKGVTCDGFSVNFSNSTTNPSGTNHTWDFGDPISGVNNTSTLPTPTHVYTDTGIYKVKLTVSIGSLCASEDTLLVRVYPGFFPDFTTVGTLCKGVPVQFTDATVANYGTPAGWSWDFGNLLVNNDSSHAKNPTYVYPDSGSYQVRLIAGSSLGCVDTIVKAVQVRNSPTINLIPRDTVICFTDTLQLRSTGSGSFVWSPNYNISSLTSPNPFVSPDVPTRYYVRLTDLFGCSTRDSVFVNVKLAVTVNAGNDTAICRTDGLTLNTTGDALHYTWTPTTYLNSDTAKRPFANPLVAVTTYKVVGNTGKCRDSSQVTITTLPYPPASAGKDTTVCFGVSTQLSASGGISYTWSPPTFLSATNIANPQVINPTATTRYIVAVRDVVGCLKPAFDTVMINVDPEVIANAGPSDTTVVLGEPLFLNGTGGVTYLWTPSTSLSNSNIPNPVANLTNNITYHLLVTSAAGCQGSDTINIKLYKVPPSFYVPTAFSPNNDGRNENLKPILLGMRTLDYFRVFDRWGKLIFYTTQKGLGWDGRYKGNPQDPGTYVWMAGGTTFTGEVIVRKGTVILIR